MIPADYPPKLGCLGCDIPSWADALYYVCRRDGEECDWDWVENSDLCPRAKDNKWGIDLRGDCDRDERS
jgi:hypothetical protein